MNVKIDSGQIANIFKALNAVSKEKPAEIKSFKETVLSDLKEISRDAQNLKGVDAENSNITINQDVINYAVAFHINQQILVNAEGSVNKEEKLLEVVFSHTFFRDVADEGRLVSKKYEFNLRMSANFEETVLLTQRNEHEDIITFVQRLIGVIFDSLNDESNSLKTILLDKRAFDEIVKQDYQNLANVLQSLLGAVFSLVKYKELNNSKNKVGVIARPDLEERIVKEYVVKKINSLTIEINEGDQSIPQNTNRFAQ